MAGESEWTTGSAFTANSHNAVLASNAMSPSTATGIAAIGSASHSNYPLADGYLYVSFTAAPSSATNTINLYKRPMNIAGNTAADAPVPGSASVSAGYFTSVQALATTGAMYLPLENIPLPGPSMDVEFYIENKTNQEIAASWTLVLMPKALVPGT